MDITKLRRVVADTNTSIGKLRLYRVSDTGKCKEFLSTLKSDVLIRALLPHIACLLPGNSPHQELVAITPDQVEQLSGEDVEAIAGAYVTSDTWKGQSSLVQGTDEPITVFMERFLRKEAENGSTRGIFDQMRESSLALGETWREFERRSKASELAKAPISGTNPLGQAELYQRLERERAEDREMIRLTGQMSVQSAKTLQELADAASTMLEQLEKRDVEAKRTTKIQLWVAVGSVFISLIVSVMAYCQDRANTVAGDKWQAKVLDEMKVSNKHGASLLVENKLLQDRVKQLSETVKAR